MKVKFTLKKKMPWTEIRSRVNSYIVKHNLQTTEEKLYINIDSGLAQLSNKIIVDQVVRIDQLQQLIHEHSKIDNITKAVELL